VSQAERIYRFEVKFVGPPPQRVAVEYWLRSHPAAFRTAYPPRRVNNVYFDDYDLSTFGENLTGISQRTKVRFRWYGSDAREPPGTLELKFKRNRLGWKQGYRLASLPLLGIAWSDVVRNLREQLPLEGRTWLDAHPQPVLINSYLRHYYVSSDGRVRITLDGGQRVCDQRFHSTPNLHAFVNLPETLIVEVKADSTDHELAGRVVQGIPIRAGRHSKYVVGVQSMLVDV
jgi:hypothetical protein